MESENETKLEEFTRSIVKDLGVESPSFDFTEKVMSSIQIEKEKITYKPLISKKVWIALLIIAVLFVIGIVSSDITITEGWMGTTFGQYSENIFTKFRFSTVMTYGIVAMALMLGIQTMLLKGYLQNRYNE